MCQDQQNHESGLHFINRHSFGDHYRETLETEMAATDQLQAMRVIPGSAAAAADIEPGDQLLSLNDQAVPEGPDAPEQLEQMQKDALSHSPTLKFSLQRGEQIYDVSLQTMPVCDYPVYLKLGNALNAYTESGAIYVTKGMMRFTENDQELALVIAHELAHNLMQHNKAKTTQYVLGSTLDLAASAVGLDTKNRFGNAAALSYSQEYEAEADYIGLYIMANANIPLEGTANFWRRMAIEHPASIETSHSASHPSTASRYLAIEKTITEIQRKQARNQPLLPEYKEGR